MVCEFGNFDRVERVHAGLEHRAVDPQVFSDVVGMARGASAEGVDEVGQFDESRAAVRSTIVSSRARNAGSVG